MEAETIKRQEALLHEEEQAAAEEEQRAAARAEVRWALGTSVWRGAFEHVLLAAKWRQRAAAAYWVFPADGCVAADALLRPQMAP